MPVLKIQSGPARGEGFRFDRSVLIGRGPMADLSLNDPMVSRRHALLTWEEDRCYVSDLGSDNGTFVNNHRVEEPTRLRQGDRISLGTSILEFEHDETPAPASGTSTQVRVVEQASDAEILMTMSAETPALDIGESDEQARSNLTRQFQFLQSIGDTLAKAFDEEELLSLVLDQLLELLPQTERAFVMRWNEDREELVPHIGKTREEGYESEIATSTTLLDDVVRRREGVLVVESGSSTRYSSAVSMHELQIRSAICVPILFRERLFGVVQVDCSYRRQGYDRSDMALLLAIASQVGMFLSYAQLHSRLLDRELLERDLELARTIHRHFLPAGAPAVHGHQFAFEYSPALAVGGDFFDFLDLPGGRLGVAVGDVSGKGISAALYVARLSSDVRYHSVGEAEPGEILRRVNRALCENSESAMFVTLTLLSLHPYTGEMLVASAGHPLPLIRNADGDLYTVGHSGDPPLGIDPKRHFEQRSYDLEHNDLVTLFTDGVTEAEDEDRQMFGVERLESAVRAGSPEEEARATLQRILVDVKGFSGGAAQSDDITVVCLRRTATS